MRARGTLALLIALSSTAVAEPKPAPVDVAPFRDRLLVLQDPDGGLYVVDPGQDGRVFYGADNGAKVRTLYEQITMSRTRNGEQGSWDIAMLAPLVPGSQPGIVGREADGTFRRFCGNRDTTTALTQLTGDNARAMLARSRFLTTALVRQPFLLARDDAGVYYYVDVIRETYGGNGHRVFVGKKGAMKQRPLTDIVDDSAGQVFSTRTGELRLVRDVSSGGATVTWVKGERRVVLRVIDLFVNGPLVYRDLGVYTFTGTICSHL